jgi:transposase-like protein
LFVHGVIVSYETIRKWCQKFGQAHTNQRRRPGQATNGSCMRYF